MYNDFYGFSEKPFQLKPDPECIFMSPNHKKAMTYLEYGFMEAISIILLTGDVGTGKTTLLNHIRHQYCDRLNTVFIANANLTPMEFLELVLAGLGFDRTPPGKPQCLELLHKYFLALSTSDEKVLLIVDDAQNLSTDALEEIRLLFSLEAEPHTSLQVLLVGQSELRAKLHSPNLMSLAQRVGVNAHLSPLAPDEIKAYIDHRLEAVGGAQDLFEEKAIERIAVASGGIPRAINQLCDAALVYGYGHNCKAIGDTILNQVIYERSGFGLVENKDSYMAADAQAADAPSRSTAALGLEEMMQRIQALERSMVALTAESAPKEPDRNDGPQVRELKRKLNVTKKLLAEEITKRKALVSEIERLKHGSAAEKRDEQPYEQRQATLRAAT